MLPEKSDIPYSAMNQTKITPIGLCPLKATVTVPQYRGYALTSHFQPIYSVAHRRIAGYEGLIRATSSDGTPVTPLELLTVPQNSSQMLRLDRLCRTLHVENFISQSVGTSSGWLFVNLNSQCLVNEQPDNGFTRQLLKSSGLASHRLVIEILESEITDHRRLKSFIDHLHQLNCLIAIDDFGAGHSNFDRIWQLEPDIVKIDRNLIKEAALSRRAKRILSGIVSLLHQAGSLVVIEGIETEQEATTAIGVNADMMQGYYFSRPAPLLFTDGSHSNAIDQLLLHQKDQRTHQSLRKNHEIQQIKDLFSQALNYYVEHRNLQQSSTRIFCDSRAIRCFVVDEAGYQTENVLNNFHHKERTQLRFAPLLCGDNGNWSHRPYHYRALEQPGVTIASEPYLSVADSEMCITLSQTVTIDNKVQVFCCDLNWQDSP